MHNQKDKLSGVYAKLIAARKGVQLGDKITFTADDVPGKHTRVVRGFTSGGNPLVTFGGGNNVIVYHSIITSHIPKTA